MSDAGGYMDWTAFESDVRFGEAQAEGVIGACRRAISFLETLQELRRKSGRNLDDWQGPFADEARERLARQDLQLSRRITEIQQIIGAVRRAEDRAVREQVARDHRNRERETLAWSQENGVLL